MKHVQQRREIGKTAWRVHKPEAMHMIYASIPAENPN
jgi:hypothetical protein